MFFSCWRNLFDTLLYWLEGGIGLDWDWLGWAGLVVFYTGEGILRKCHTREVLDLLGPLKGTAFGNQNGTYVERLPLND
jgi:hypothetical protein